MKANYCNELEAAAVLRDVNEWGGYIMIEQMGRTSTGLMRGRLRICHHPRRAAPDELYDRVFERANDIAVLLMRMCA